MKRLKSIVLAGMALFVMVGVTLPAAPAAAQSAGSAALSIAPKKNYVINPGDSVDDKLTIRNLDNTQTLQLNLRVIDFTYTDNSGTPKLFLDPKAPQTTWSLKPYMTVPKSVTIAPSESVSLDMNVAIPANVGAGSYYSAIIYSTGAPDGGNVGLAASGVTLAFVSVPGTVNEKLDLKKFGAYDQAARIGDADGYKFFMTDEPQVLAYTLENSGNVAESPVGSITVKDIFGNERVIENINPSGSLALIGQTRTFTACIKLKSQDVNFQGSDSEANTCTAAGLWPGVYTANLDLFYGQNGNKTQEITKTAVFWYMPWWFIVLSIIVLLVLAYFVWRIVRWFRAKFYGPRVPRGRKSLRRRR